MAINEGIGSKLKELRTQNDLTLKQVSERVGLSQGFLSQVERGRATVGMNALSKIAEMYGVDISIFFSHQADTGESPVIRSYDRWNMQVSSEFIQYSLSSSMDRGNINIYIYELMPNTFLDESQPLIFNHASAEFIYILEGVITETVEGVETTLFPGDCMHIASYVDHSWVNNTNKIVKLLAIQKCFDIPKHE